MKDLLNIIVSCTKRKNQPIPARLMLRSVRKVSLDDRCTDWIERLSSNENKTPATNLYSGDHWKVAQSFKALGEQKGYKVRLWVCSAGYGLITSECTISPYSATFSPNNPDSVSKKINGGFSNNELCLWWEKLSNWQGPGTNNLPRTLEELNSENPKSFIWVVASNEYLCSLSTDILNLTKSIKTPERFSIFSAGTNSFPEIAPHLLPLDARLQNLVGGTMGSLNVRIARNALESVNKTGPSFVALKNRFDKLLQQQPALKSYNRKIMTDDEVKNYIQKNIRENPSVNFSPLLRAFRDNGFACEYKRFSKLFSQLKETNG